MLRNFRLYERAGPGRAESVRAMKCRMWSSQVPAGALVVLHGSNVHFSRPNRSPASRHAYTMHVVDGEAAWAPHNWCACSALAYTSGDTLRPALWDQRGWLATRSVAFLHNVQCTQPRHSKY